MSLLTGPSSSRVPEESVSKKEVDRGRTTFGGETTRRGEGGEKTRKKRIVSFQSQLGDRKEKRVSRKKARSTEGGTVAKGNGRDGTYRWGAYGTK